MPDALSDARCLGGLFAVTVTARWPDRLRGSLSRGPHQFFHRRKGREVSQEAGAERGGELKIKNLKRSGLPWWSSGYDSAFQCRGHGFDPVCQKKTKKPKKVDQDVMLF